MSGRARTIVITGFMAAGKTTVAQELANLLGARMIDLDYLIAERERRGPHALINEEGEAEFRERERGALRVVLEMNRARVIALGGGTWMLESNRELIARHGCFTVWLDAPFELCWRRIARDEVERPLARSEAAARALYDERRPVYALAGLRLDAGAGKTAGALAGEILEAL
jgi:shikimate kinase